MASKFDICIIGAGAAGLSVAAVASQLGLKVALIEGALMGGDCLNYGCVPSKALLAAAKLVYKINNSQHYGISATCAAVDIPRVLNEVRQVIARIEPNDSIERFTKLGVHVYSAWASFINSTTIVAGNEELEAKYFVIASGARATIPLIKGLDQVPYYTNETIFNLDVTPEHLIVLGGGPIGCELAQAFAMLGIKVSLIVRSHLLPKDEDDLVNILRSTMLKQGIAIYEAADIVALTQNDKQIEVQINHNGTDMLLQGSHLLVATGRSPNIKQLNLTAAAVEYSAKGIAVDARLRTSNKRIFAIGDVTGGYEFTHIAGYHAGIVIQNIIFRRRARVNYAAIPWVTYTYPELAHAGLTLKEARSRYGHKIKLTQFNYNDNDRARTEHEEVGQLQLITKQGGRVLGVSIIGYNAGEILAPWIDLINRGDSVKALTKNILPYPTFSEINKQVVSKYYAPLLFSAKVKLLVRFLKLFW